MLEAGDARSDSLFITATQQSPSQRKHYSPLHHKETAPRPLRPRAHGSTEGGWLAAAPVISSLLVSRERLALAERESGREEQAGRRQVFLSGRARAQQGRALRPLAREAAEAAQTASPLRWRAVAASPCRSSRENRKKSQERRRPGRCSRRCVAAAAASGEKLGASGGRTHCAAP